MKAIIEFYASTRQQSIDICLPLEIEDFVVQPKPFVSPPKWHLAHTTWFLEEMILKAYQKDYKVFHPDFAYLFNSYYNTLGTRTLRADRGNMTRPTVAQIMDYRRYVDQHMIDLLSQNEDTSLVEIVTTAMHHEQQHQELLWSDIKYILGHNPLFPVYQKNGALVKQFNTDEGWIEIEEGTYWIGHEQKEGFYFDNETGRHQTFVQKSSINKALVTNGEYLEFIEAGAYENFQRWLDDAWAWLKEMGIKAPLHWHHIDGQWYQYTLGGLEELDPNALLTHISCYEAQAFAAWKGMRLPTEFEWEVAAQDLAWGERWEWTQSAYLPYPGFKIAEGALGEYNGKFMSNQMVLRGASVATSYGHSRTTYRNFFQALHQWQFTGIRLAK